MSRSELPTTLLTAAALTFALTLGGQLIPRRASDGVAGKVQAPPPSAIAKQSQEDADRKSVGCLTCHTPDTKSMHPTEVRAGCTDCHGGNAGATRDKSVARDSSQFRDIQRQAHVEPRLDMWRTSANPPSVWEQSLRESAEFIRFVNPGDLRVARQTCGQCHLEETRNNEKSSMRHGGMLWGAALYNNGSFPFKNM